MQQVAVSRFLVNLIPRGLYTRQCFRIQGLPACFFPQRYYNGSMDIETVSVDMSQTMVQEQAAVQVQAMSLDTEKEQAAAVDTLISSAQPITDPNLGQTVNLLD